MQFAKHYQLALLPAVVLGALSSVSNAHCPCLLDPVIRHTNGMPIATSQPCRTNSVSWTCNPDQLGYCGGRYYWPCVDSMRCYRLRDAAHGCYTPAEHRRYKAYIGCVCPVGQPYASTQAGIEPTGMAELGQIPNDALSLGGIGAPVARPAGVGR